MSRRTTRGGALPLIEWGEELRLRKAARRRCIRRLSALVAPVCVALTATIALPSRPRLVWNASASAPIGLYLVSLPRGLSAGDMVIARVPAAVRMLAAKRHYLPLNVPLVKHVGAVQGETVCVLGPAIFVDGKRVATRLGRDGHGRRMPWWRGCRRLGGGELFLLSPQAPASFDGRYFGVSPASDLLGQATLLWAR